MTRSILWLPYLQFFLLATVIILLPVIVVRLILARMPETPGSPEPAISGRVIVVGGDHNYPPYEYLLNGQPTGFNIDLVRAAAKTMGLEVEFRLGPWKDVRTQLENGKLDMLGGMAYSAERESLYDFSISHSQVSFDLFTLNGSPIKSLTEATHARIAVQEGGLMHDFLLRQSVEGQIVLVRNVPDALRLLESGQVDAALLNKMQGLYFSDQLGITNIITLNLNLLPTPYGFAVVEGNQELLWEMNEGLNIIKTNGQYRDIYEDWFGVYEQKSAWQSIQFYAYGLILIFVLFTVTMAWSWSLRGLVKARTSELRESEERYRLLFQQAPVGIIHYDTAFRITDVNDRVLRQLKGNQDTLVGRDLLTLMTNPNLLIALTAALEGRNGQYEGEFHPFDKESRYIQLITAPFKPAGQEISGGMAIFQDITDRKNAERQILRFNLELTEAYDATIVGWARALELRDGETEGHSQRVTELTVALGHMMGMDEQQLMFLRRGSLLHDIGKMGIPDHILLKPGPLDAQEWEVMRMHPVYAYQMFKSIKFLVPSLDIPYCHHERWDGTGYPRGLKGEEIPLAARVFSVIDVWDALLSDRPYRPAWERNRVIDYIRQNSGVQFDPAVVNAFFSLLKKNEEDQVRLTM